MQANTTDMSALAKDKGGSMKVSGNCEYTIGAEFDLKDISNLDAEKLQILFCNGANMRAVSAEEDRDLEFEADLTRRVGLKICFSGSP